MPKNSRELESQESMPSAREGAPGTRAGESGVLSSDIAAGTPAPASPQPEGAPTAAADAAATLEPTIEEHFEQSGEEGESPAETTNRRALFNAAKAYNQWGIGKRMSRADYDAAIEKIANLQFQ